MIGFPIAVSHPEHSQCRTKTKKQEALYLTRMIRIIDQQAVFVGKDGFSFLKGNTMLLLILCIDLRSSHSNLSSAIHMV